MIQKLKEIFQKEEPEAVVECQHEWHIAGTAHEEVYNGKEPEYYNVVSIYCPKCETSETTSFENWDIIKNQQRISKEYKKAVKHD